MFKEACTYMFKDNKIAQKLGAFFLLRTIISTIQACIKYTNIDASLRSLLYVLIIFLGIFGYGYYCNCIKSVIMQVKSENIVLPYFFTYEHLQTGFKLFLAFLPALLLYVLSMSFAAVIFSVELLIFILVLMLLFCLLFIPALMWIFSYTGRVDLFSKLSIMPKIMGYNFKKYLLTCFIILMIWLGLSALQYVSINFANFLLWDGTNFVEYMRIIVPSINQGKISLTMNFKTLIFLLPYFFVNVYCYYVIAHLIGRLFTAEEFEKIIANKGGMAEN